MLLAQNTDPVQQMILLLNQTTLGIQSHHEWLNQEQDLNLFKLVSKYVYMFGVTTSFAVSTYIIDYYAKKSATATAKKDKELDEKLEKYRIRGNKNSSDEDS